MAFESSVAAPSIQWDLILNWPALPHGQAAAGYALTNTRMGWPSQGTHQSPNTNSAIEEMGFQGVAGGGVAAEDMMMEDSTYCYGVRTIAAAAFRHADWWGWPCVPKVRQLNTNMSPGAATPSWTRVWWGRILCKFANDNIGLESGIGLTEFHGPIGNAQWFDQIAAIQPGGWGIVGNGLGTGFNYVSYTPGVAHPAGLIESVPIAPAAAPLGNWNTYDFIILNSAPSRNASSIVAVNGATIVTRNWTAGPGQLPLYSDAAHVGYQLVMRIADAGGAGADMFVAGVTIRMGRFTPDGLELTD